MKRLLVNISLVILSVGLGLLAVEVILRIPAVNRLAEYSPEMHLYRTDSAVGWSHQPNMRMNWNTDNLGDNDIQVEVKINSLGLRDKEHAYRKPDGSFRILILGDSFTEALQVPLEMAYPTRLEACLNDRLAAPIEVINGGVSSYGLGEEYLQYINEGVKYDPDLVLVAFYTGNDLADLDRNDDKGMIRFFGGYKFTLEDDQLQKQWISWDEPSYEISGLESLLRRYSMIYRVLRHPQYKFYWWYANLTKEEPAPKALPDWETYVFTQDFSHNPDTPPQLKKMWVLFQRLLTEMVKATTANGDQLGVMLIPEKRQVHQSQLNKQIKIMEQQFSDFYTVQWDMTEPNRTLVNYFNQLQIPVLDLQPYFQAHELSGGYLLYLEDDIHYNQDGHRLTADILCDWLVKNEAINLPRP